MYKISEFSKITNLTTKTLRYYDEENITPKQLPPLKALCTTHIGTYETLNMAYKAILDYAQKHNLKYSVPSREAYIKGPGKIFKGNPNKYVTEIIIPIE